MAITASHLPGVFTATKKDGGIYYRSSLTYKMRHISLGSYAMEEQAFKAYQEGTSLLASQMTILDYPSNATLSFEKWVILVNFRDNGIYFATPLYIRPSLLYYYLSPSEVLKFDKDELFYYSSHKISRRGGHLYLADYGSQLSVLKRYGIKPYAVLGKDYRFKNGDALDFRSGNVEILSSYHGVHAIMCSGKLQYKAFIHVRGNYLIGQFTTETEAAIAYNKAADYLKAAGYKKAYPTNYIDEIRPSEYASLYAAITLPDKLLSLKTSTS